MSTQSTGLRTAGKTKLLLATVMAAGAAFAFSSTSAKASIIFQDNFPGSSTSPLAGTTPATTTGGAKWTEIAGSTTSFNADGSISNNSTTTAVQGGDYLSYSVTSGYVYTLSATLNPSFQGTSGLGYVGIEFGNAIPLLQNGPAFLMHYGTSTTGSLQAFASKKNAVKLSSATVTSNETAQIVLDTTSTLWTASFIYDGVTLGTYNYTTNPGGNSLDVAIVGKSEDFTGNVGSFELTQTAVPEPASIGLFGLGAVGLLLARRKRA